jgi:mono/diheme cytochrome c family protein
VLTSSFLDEVLGSLPVEGRAQVDLVVLRNRTGQSAFIPRALFAKYPMLLAIEGGSLHSVVPWSSKVRILKEDLPIESFFMSNVTELELTNYKERFSPFFLKRRTDPSAIRGEKLFVQNCVTCHSVERGSSVSAVSAMLKTMEKVNRAAAQSFGVQEHSGINVLTHLTQRDHRSIFRYLEAHRSENPT